MLGQSAIGIPDGRTPIFPPQRRPSEAAENPYVAFFPAEVDRVASTSALHWLREDVRRNRPTYAGIGNRSHSVGGPSVIPYPEPYRYPDLEHGGIKLQWSSHSARDRPGAS